MVSKIDRFLVATFITAPGVILLLITSVFAFGLPLQDVVSGNWRYIEFLWVLSLPLAWVCGLTGVIASAKIVAGRYPGTMARRSFAIGTAAATYGAWFMREYPPLFPSMALLLACAGVALIARFSR